MRVFRSVLAVIAGVGLLAVPTPPAQAAPPRIPITCGMVVQQDAELYLEADLHCPDFGIRVVQPPGEPGPGPSVVVDLRGHTLRGSGTGDGISANNAGGSDFIRVRNGQLRNWDEAVSGDWDTHIRDVALVGNRVGFFCEGSCIADRTLFKGNTGTGLFVGFAADATVTHSTLLRNAVGASVGFPWHLSITTSRFIRNDVGVLGVDSRVPIFRSLFVRNATAIRIDDSGGLGGCADLDRVRFVRNGVRVDGPICTA